MGTIVIGDADHLIPDDTLTTALKKYSKGNGLALATEGTLECMTSVGAYPSMAEALEDINKVQCPLKAETLVYYFTNYPDKLLDDDLQPFLLIADKKEDGSDDPMVMAFIDGDIDESFEPDASGHTREYMAVNGYLAPKLQRIYAQVGDDLEDFLKQLEDPLLKRELLGTLFDGTGNMVLIAATGDVATFSVKSEEKTYDWGWMSDPCGYGEHPEAVQPQLPQGVKNAAKGVLAGLKAGMAAATSAVKPDKTKEPTMVWVKPPKHIRQDSNNKKKTWYESRIAVVPLDWKQCPAILMNIERATKEGLEILKPEEVGKPLPDGVHEVKPVETNVLESSSPIIPSKEQDYVVKEFLEEPEIKKYLDGNSAAITNPAENEETKYPTFCEKAGLKGLEQTLRWDRTKLRRMFITAPNMALELYLNTRSAYVSQLSEKKPAAETKPSTPASKAPASQVLGLPQSNKRKRM